MTSKMKCVASIAIIVCCFIAISSAVKAEPKGKKGPTLIEYKPTGTLKAWEFVAAFQNNPFGYYFEELKSYDTDLKRKAFLKTDEGKQKLASLDEEKKKILEASYEVILGEVDRYNTKQGTFPIILPREPPGAFRERAWIIEMGQFLGDALSGVWLPDNKLKVQVAEEEFLGMYRRVMIKIPEDSALKIENAGEGNTARIKFHLTGKVHGWKSTSNLDSGYYQQKWALEIKDITIQFYDKQKSLLFEKQL